MELRGREKSDSGERRQQQRHAGFERPKRPKRAAHSEHPVPRVRLPFTLFLRRLRPIGRMLSGCGRSKIRRLARQPFRADFQQSRPEQINEHF